MSSRFGMTMLFSVLVRLLLVYPLCGTIVAITDLVALGLLYGEEASVFLDFVAIMGVFVGLVIGLFLAYPTRNVPVPLIVLTMGVGAMVFGALGAVLHITGTFFGSCLGLIVGACVLLSVYLEKPSGATN